MEKDACLQYNPKLRTESYCFYKATLWNYLIMTFMLLNAYIILKEKNQCTCILAKWLALRSVNHKQLSITRLQKLKILYSELWLLEGVSVTCVN